jgi:predicted TIM-barrel fold metal-dependent hydrolase
MADAKVVIARRRILQLGAVALPVFAAADRPTTVIDAAVHFYDTARPQGVPWPPKNSAVLYKRTLPDRYEEAVRPLRIDGVVAIEASPWLEDNLWLLGLGDRTPLIRAVVGNIPPGHPDYAAALDRFSKHPLFRGIRINANSVPRILADPAMSADLKRLSDKDLHLDILVNAPTWGEIAELAGRLPDLRIVVGHLPLDAPKDSGAREKFASGLRALGGRPRVFAKVSGVVRRVNSAVLTDPAFYKPPLDELWDAFGPDRVIYASNWPTSDMIAPYDKVYDVISGYVTARPKDEVEKFFWKNSLTAYKWRQNA